VEAPAFWLRLDTPDAIHAMKNLAGGAESVRAREKERERERERNGKTKKGRREGGRERERGRRGVVRRPRELGAYLFMPIMTVQDFISVSERLPPLCQFICTYA